MPRRDRGEFGVKVTLRSTAESDAAPPTPADAPVVKALENAVERSTAGEGHGHRRRDGRGLFRRDGFDAACWSRLDETAHQPNEYCIIDNMIGDAKVFAHIMTQE